MTQPGAALLPAAALAFVGAAAAVYALTPAVASLARRLGLVDRPGGRKVHDRAIPRLGGVALFLGLLTGSLVYGCCFGWSRLERVLSGEAFALLLLPAGFVFLVGVVDDVRGLGPAPRVVGEILAAGILIQSGFVIDVIANPFGAPIHLGLLSIPVTLLWFVGVTNSYNLVDGLDGLMTTLGLVALAGCAAVAFLAGQTGTGVFALALAGALAGFLRWNWHPARIFLGDSGSLLVGFTVAALSLKVARNPSGVLNFHVPLALSAIPIGETFLTLARRYVNGHAYFSGDQSHIHHVLVKAGLGVPRAVLSLGAVAALFAAVAVLSLSWRSWGTVATIAVLLLAAAAGLARLRYLEVRVFLDRVRANLFRPRRKGLPDLLAVAKAGDCVRGAASLPDLRDRLRAAVVEGRFAFVSVEFTPEGAEALDLREPHSECRNDEARAYDATRNGGPRWLFSTESSGCRGDPQRLAASAVAFPLPGDGSLGRLVCQRFMDADTPAPPSQDVRQYFAEPVAEELLKLAAAPVPGGAPARAAPTIATPGRADTPHLLIPKPYS